MARDVCKLTGTTGKFVKSHLIPKALTRPEEPGLPLIQSGSGERRKVRWDSWYDKKLVTRAGEDILSNFDNWAIKYLRDQKLIWSGWGPMTGLGALHTPFPETPWGIRKVKVDQPDKLRLFFSSILWRAAASTLPEFSEVNMPAADLEQLREMLVTENLKPVSFYPISLTQLSTLGIIHNMTPLAQIKQIPELGSAQENSTARDIPIFRFYFDGLVAHVHNHATDDGLSKELGKMLVGADGELVLSTVTYENSFEHENLSYVMAETIYDPNDRYW